MFLYYTHYGVENVFTFVGFIFPSGHFLAPLFETLNMNDGEGCGRVKMAVRDGSGS